MEFSVVIPVFNEAESIKIVQERLDRVMKSVSSQYEIIYVDDGSIDYSLVVLKELARDFPEIKIISFKENRGQSAASYAGFKICKGAWIITLDADGQNPPEEIVRLLEFRKDFDFITGIRCKRSDNFIRRGISAVARFFRWFILADITTDTGCSLRMFKREIVDSLCFFNNFHRFFSLLVRNKGFLIKEICVMHDRRKLGRSKYGICKRLREGLFDVWGVFWLKRRLINYEIKFRR